MKILKIVGLVVILLIAIVLIASFIVPNEMKYEKSVSINAPVDLVWENVNGLEDMNKWSPWNEKDPGMDQSISGTDGTVGAVHTWNSDNEDVGSGSQTIAKLEAPTLVETDLKFFEPYESEAKAFVKLNADGGNTTATWGFYSEMPRPMNLMMLGADMDEMLGPDFTNGLNKLKLMSEEMQARMEMEAADTVSTEGEMDM